MFDTFKSFLRKYAGEALGVAEAFNTVLTGLALPKAEAQKIAEIIDKLQAANASILGGLDNMPVVKIERQDIEDAVSAVAYPLILKAVEEALAKKDAGNV